MIEKGFQGKWKKRMGGEAKKNILWGKVNSNHHHLVWNEHTLCWALSMREGNDRTVTERREDSMTKLKRVSDHSHESLIFSASLSSSSNTWYSHITWSILKAQLHIVLHRFQQRYSCFEGVFPLFRNGVLNNFFQGIHWISFAKRDLLEGILLTVDSC